MVEGTLVPSLVARACETTHGFGDIRDEAERLVRELPSMECFCVAQELYASVEHQARMIATLTLGMLAAEMPVALATLRERVSLDLDWRVLETLAQAFDRFCKSTGYEQSLPVIRDWLADPNPNVRRAVTEGLRIWTSRAYFKEHPEAAVEMPDVLKADPSDYVRRSVGNALRDISRKYPALVKAATEARDLSDKSTVQTYKLAARFIDK